MFLGISNPKSPFYNPKESEKYYDFLLFKNDLSDIISYANSIITNDKIEIVC